MTHGIDTGFLVAAEVAEHADHQAARLKFKDFRAAGDRFALVPQVLAEFVHVVTDPKRFTQPLTMEAALERAEIWWDSPEMDQLGSDAFSVRTFFDWMRQHRLGRKRILDTLLASTFREAGIQSILTTNARDFAVLGAFVCVVP
ncbi:PIN domain-containing protein [Prosthecobacter sp.]|uniref:PIN domain-containing protein n=1 Tax=Prosthecobacter sp. TaxID=1965333 RepID=UPI0037832C96